MTSRFERVAGAGPMALLFLLPLLASLLLLLPGFLDSEAFARLFAHPQFMGAVRLTLATGVVSTFLAVLLAVAVMRFMDGQTQARSGVMLAVPHLALAIGLGFLIAPTGLIARLIAQAMTGWTSPPPWPTTQDPYGLALMLALVLKEVPFLVWAMTLVSSQDELRNRFRREALVARSLGHGPRAAYLRVVLPQILSRSMWPITAVFTYSMTVVDMALVIGPTQPPTLAQLVWTDLNDADPIVNARGAAGTLFLAGITLVLLALATILYRAKRTLRSWWLTRPATPEALRLSSGPAVWSGLHLVYGLVLLALLLQSISVLWPFPSLIADEWTLSQWQRALAAPKLLLTSILLAAFASTASLLAVVLWFETQRLRADRMVFAGVLLALCLPALLLALGHYRLLLWLGWTGTEPGLLLVHVIPSLAYVFVMLQGPYRAYDHRWHMAVQGLRAGRMRFLLAVKWPMLKPALASAWAVGFAVSLAQYVPAQLAAAGRFATVPMEAVTLTSGGNRALIAVYGVILMLLPLAGFALASTVGKSRWGRA